MEAKQKPPGTDLRRVLSTGYRHLTAQLAFYGSSGILAVGSQLPK